MFLRSLSSALLVLTLGLGTAQAQMIGPGPSSEESGEAHLSVSGKVSLVNHAQRTLELGEAQFYVPTGVAGFSGLGAGDSVLIHYESVEGTNVVSALEDAHSD